MQFGIFDHLDRRDEPLEKFFNDRLALVRAVEAAGFYSYHIAEHHGTPLGMAPSPNLFLAAMARETRRLRFGPLVYLLPLYHPVRLIEEVCMLDHLSGGRLDMGVGRGISPYEVACYGIEPKATREMFEEALDVVLKGLQSTRLDHAGKWYRVADMPLELGPLQKPYPPLWYGVASDSSARFAASYGMHFTTLGGNARVKELVAGYKRLWEETRSDPRRVGGPDKTPLIGVGRHIFIAETDGEAERLARPAYVHWYASVSKLWRDHGAQPVTGMLIPSYDEAVRVGAVVAGTPAMVRATLAQQIAGIGFNYLLGQFAWGCLGHEQEMRSFRLFVSEVMPALARL